MFYHIGIQSIGMDEGATYLYSQKSFLETLLSREPNSPSYYVVEGWILAIFGKTNIAIKGLSAVCGALCGVFTYLASRDIFHSRCAAITAAVMVVLSPVMIWYGQEARGFSCVACLVMCQMWIFINALTERDNTKLWVLLAIISALAVHAHYVAIMPTMLIYFFSFAYLGNWKISECRKIPLFRSFVLMIILVLPIAISLYYTVIGVFTPGMSWSSGSDYNDELIFAFFYENELYSYIFVILAILGSLFALWKYRRDALVLLFVSLIPILFTISVSFTTHVHYRYVIFCAPIFYILITCPLAYLKDKPMFAGAGTIVCSALLILAAAPVLSDYYNTPMRDNFEELCVVLEDEINEGDCIVISPSWVDWGLDGCLSFYYDNRDNTPVIVADTLDELSAVLSNPDFHTVFLITWDYDNEVINWAKSPSNAEILYGTSNLTLFRAI